MADGNGNATQIWIAIIGAITAIATALIAAGILNSGHDKPDTPPTQTASPAQQPAKAEPKPEAPANLEGDWVALNNKTRITQDKAAINMDAMVTVPGAQPVTYSANGTVTGHSLQWDFRSSAGDAGHCSGTIERSDDRLQAHCKHLGGFESDVTLTRVT